MRFRKVVICLKLYMVFGFWCVLCDEDSGCNVYYILIIKIDVKRFVILRVNKDEVLLVDGYTLFL